MQFVEKTDVGDGLADKKGTSEGCESEMKAAGSAKPCWAPTVA